MKWPYRVHWLPVLALVVPCVFIGLLGYRWLALEREAAGRRGADAAKAAVAAVRHDLTEHLVNLGDVIARRLRDLDIGRPPFQPPPPLPPIVGLAFLFDQSGELVAPNDQAAYEHAVEAHRVAAMNPTWQRAYSRAPSLEASGQQSHAIAAARTLLTQSQEPSLQASALLLLARASAAAGQMEAAERYTREVMACCAADRDEYGMSFALYAAWQLVALFDGQSRHPDALAVRDLRSLVDRGYLGAATDVDAVALLAKKAEGHKGLADVAEDVARAGRTIQLRVEAAHLAGRWLNQTEASIDQAVPHEPDIFGRDISQHWRGLARPRGNGHLYRSGPLHRDRQSAGSRRLQDSNAPRSRTHGAVHARRKLRDARSRRRLLQRGRTEESQP